MGHTGAPDSRYGELMPGRPAADANMSIRMNGAELSRQLNRRGITQADLAEVSGVVPATVSRAINGHPISPRSYRKISEALERVPECGRGLLEE
jgi:predicted transcriptional regulator